MKKTHDTIPLCILLLLWGFLSLFCWLKPADSFSLSERRKLATPPAPNISTIVSGDFSREFDACAPDQFPFRDRFRTLKAVSELGLFARSDNNGIYLSDGHAVKTEYPLNEKSVRNAIKKCNALYETYLCGTSGAIYLSIIPDKAYFLSAGSGHPALDYDKLSDTVRNGMPYAGYIDIFPTLNADDYYKTDSHWKQECLTDTAQLLADSMGISISGNYEQILADRPFYGVYYGQSALPLKADAICCLTNSTLHDCRLYNEETKHFSALYDFDKLSGRDMYEVYLSGASAILTISNPHAGQEKELIVFRDSFASSLIPLLAEGYSKITLLDTRYIRPELLGEYVDFTNADILFLYSTTLLNNSYSLK